MSENETPADEAAAPEVLPPAVESHTMKTVIHDMSVADRKIESDDRARESETRERAEDARIAKSEKKSQLLKMQRENAKEVKALIKERAEAEVELERAAKAQVKALNGTQPTFVAQIVAGFAEGGLDKQAVLSYEYVNLFDKELKILVKLWIIGKDDKFVGDAEDGYSHMSSSKFQSDDLYIAPDQAGKSAWDKLTESKQACSANNQMGQDIREALILIEEAGETVEVAILKDGLSDKRKERVKKMDGVYSEMLGADASKLLGAATAAADDTASE